VIIPATPGQLRFYVLDAQEGGAARTLVKQITIEGAVDAERFRQAWHQVIAAQPALRTSLPLTGEGLGQRIHPVNAVDLRIELTDEPQALLDEAAAALHVPFEHGLAPLCRVHGMVGPSQTQCLFSVHHAVFDEDSTVLLIGQLAAAYDARGPEAIPAAPTDPGPSVIDEGRLRAFWSGQLRDLPLEDTALPWGAGNASGSRRAVYSRALPAALVRRIRERNRSTGATPFAQFLAAAGAVISWYLDRDDVVFGVVVGGRDAENEQVIGCLQNTVPVRIRLGSADTSTVIDHVMDALFDAVENAALPIEDIMECAGIPRTPGRKPFTQILCTEAHPTPQVQGGGLLWQVTERPPDEVEYDCGLTLRHLADGGISLDIEYRSSILSPERAEGLGSHLESALDALGGDPARPLGELDLLTAADRRELATLDGGCPTPVDVPVHVLISRRAVTCPDAVALTAGGSELRYGELDRQAALLAAALAEQGVREGDRVGICLPRAVELVAAILAVWKSGAMYVPLDPGYPTRRLRFMAEDADLAIVFADHDVLPGTPWLDPRSVDTSSTVFSTGSHPSARDPQAPAYLIHTSGSTGQPKGVVVTHANLTALFDSLGRALGEPPAVTVAGTSISFDISVLELFWPLTRGRAVLLTEHQRVTEENVPYGALYQCTPTVARLLANDPAGRRMLERLEVLLVGGEPLAPDLATELAALVPGSVVNCYGPTETTVWSSTARVVADAPVAIGIPLPGESCHVVDAHGRDMPPGVPGRLIISGAGVTAGYWRRAELTKERFTCVSGPGGPYGYDTGDLAVLDIPGGLRFLGRRDSQAKVRGQRIELQEVESALRGVPVIQDVAVVVGPEADHLVAFLVAEGEPVQNRIGDGGPLPLDPDMASDLRRHAADWLTPATIPQAWFRLDALPQLPNGKLDRGTLATWAAARDSEPAPWSTTVPGSPEPGSSVELVRRAWERVLKRPVSVSAEETFFDVGGTSVGVLSVLGTLRHHYPWLVAADLFRYTTVSALAEHLGQGGQAAPVTAPAAARGAQRARALTAWRARASGRPGRPISADGDPIA
jgi:amino acid adenylation domain-containing protein